MPSHIKSRAAQGVKPWSLPKKVHTTRLVLWPEHPHEGPKPNQLSQLKSHRGFTEAVNIQTFRLEKVLKTTESNY